MRDKPRPQSEFDLSKYMFTSFPQRDVLSELSVSAPLAKTALYAIDSRASIREVWLSYESGDNPMFYLSYRRTQ